MKRSDPQFLVTYEGIHRVGMAGYPQQCHEIANNLDELGELLSRVKDFNPQVYNIAKCDPNLSKRALETYEGIARTEMLKND